MNRVRDTSSHHERILWDQGSNGLRIIKKEALVKTGSLRVNNNMIGRKGYYDTRLNLY